MRLVLSRKFGYVGVVNAIPGSAAHKAGLSVMSWTANTKVEMKRLLACGVDAITTNFPDRLKGLMG